MLLYLSGWTRPDITFAVSNVARFCSKSTREHWVIVKCTLRYLKDTINYGLMYYNDDDESSKMITGYSDVNWAGDANDRKSTSGYLFMSTSILEEQEADLCCSVYCWSWICCIILCNTGSHWLRELFKDHHNEQTKPTVIHEDNQAAIQRAESPQYHSKTKHIDIKYHYVREKGHYWATVQRMRCWNVCLWIRRSVEEICTLDRQLTFSFVILSE